MQSVGSRANGVCSHQITASRPLSAPVAPRRASRVVLRATANCPYSTLGVAPNSSDNEIKQAYRKLVLQYHPDVAGTGAERKFMSIQQAYELLTGKSHASGGAGASVQHDDWNFNDWYWSFMQKRRWGGYKKGSAAAAGHQAHQEGGAAAAGGAAFHKQPEHKSAIRSQLAGLRHRAAVRAHKQQPAWAAAAAGDPAPGAGGVDEQEGDEQQQHHQQQQQQHQHQHGEAMASLEYDSTEMSDGCNMASGVTDWEAAAAAHAAAAARRRFNANDRHKKQVMSQVAGLHRMAAATQESAGGLW